MSQASEDFEHALNALKNRGGEADRLEALAALIPRISEEQHDPTFAEFHNYAGRTSLINDSDFGALILEREADAIGKGSLKTRLYREAL